MVVWGTTNQTSGAAGVARSRSSPTLYDYTFVDSPFRRRVARTGREARVHGAGDRTARPAGAAACGAPARRTPDPETFPLPVALRYGNAIIREIRPSRRRATCSWHHTSERTTHSRFMRQRSLNQTHGTQRNAEKPRPSYFPQSGGAGETPCSVTSVPNQASRRTRLASCTPRFKVNYHVRLCEFDTCNDARGSRTP